MNTTRDIHPIVALDGVRVEAGDRYDAALEDASLSLDAGQLALVLAEPEHPHTPIADAICGIVPPSRGSVRYRGRGWDERDAVDAARARGRIGRVFENGGWINNLSVAENVTLACCHHGTADEHRAFEDAAQWARRFDLPGLPVRSVHRTLGRDLQRAACVRAFIGDRDLIVLESPTRGVFAELMPPLVNAVRDVRGDGCAVLWITTDPVVFNSRSVRPTARLRMYGNRLSPIEEPSP